MPDEIRTTIESYDRIAGEYCEHTLRDEFRRVEEEFLDRFTGHLGRGAPLIADVGCGDGRDSGYLINKGARVLLVDLSAGMLAVAARQVPLGSHLKMDVRNLALLDDYLDGLWAGGILYHLPKRHLPEALREIHRVIKPGAPRYYACYSPGEMRGLLSGLFEVIEEESYPMEAFGDTILHLWCRKPRHAAPDEACQGA